MGRATDLVGVERTARCMDIAMSGVGVTVRDCALELVLNKVQRIQALQSQSAWSAGGQDSGAQGRR
eukprot:COSAG05_NODE_1942_length_3800_cov_1.897595_1_plen_65_part_10